MWRNIASNFLTFLVVVVFLVAGVILWGQNEYNATGPLEGSICLRVERGSNMRRVSEDLEARGAVSSSTIFRIGADYTGKDSQLKAGSWLIPEGATMAEVTDLVTRGGASTCGTEVVYRIGVTQVQAQVRELDPDTETYEEVVEFDLLGEEAAPAEYTDVVAQADTRFRINIAEGVTSWQIVTALNAVDVMEGEVDGVPPEGSLAPTSYEVERGDGRVALLDRMKEIQKTRLAAAWEARDEDLPLESPADVLILASIIEKETGLPDERGQVA
ncbi:endolytic transglycosylase MltG, partial [Roseovarius indicus]